MRLEAYPQIKSALAESAAGKSLQKILRWTQFRTNESKKKWREAVGATGQVLTHSDLFYHHGPSFLKRENGRFTNSEQVTFLFGLSLHDIGESTNFESSIGDVGAYMKTSADEKREFKIAHLAIDSLNLPEETKLKLHDSYKKVVEGEDPKLHHAFKALEKTEYVLTAMKVYQNGKRMRAEGKRPLKYEAALVGRVLVYDLTKVLDVYAPAYPNSIGLLFKNAAPLIDEMFTYSLPWLEANTEWRGKAVDHKALAETFKTKWEAFKAQNP